MKNVNLYHFKEIIKKGYSLDIIFLLKELQAKNDISELCNNSKKIEAIYNSILRKQLYSEELKQLTLEGDELLKFLNTDNVLLVKKSFVKKEDFDYWWEIFPSNNKFIHKGVNFPLTRSFKTRKDDCKKLFEKIVNSKKFTAKQIIDATIVDVETKKENSVRKRENQLTFLQNTYTYLYQGTFEGYVDLSISEETNSIIVKGSTDI